MHLSRGATQDHGGHERVPTPDGVPGAPAATVLVVAPGETTAGAAEALGQAGYTCHSAATVADARHRLADGSVDVAVCAVDELSSENHALARSVRDESGAGLVLLTRLGDSDVFTLGNEFPDAHVITAPWTAVELTLAVGRSLRQTLTEREHRTTSAALEVLVAERTAELAEITATLHLRDNQMRSLLSSVPVGVIYSTDESGCEYANEAAQRLSGYGFEEFLGNGWFLLVHPDDRSLVLEELQACKEHEEIRVFEGRIVRKDGMALYLSIRLGPVHDDRGVGVGYVATLEDITARKRAEQELAWQATHDPLTGLPNRKAIEDRVTEAAAEGVGRVALIDLDGFKAVNDRHGHAAGDRLLIRTARALARRFTGDCFVGRYGGDEFVIVCACSAEDGCFDLGAEVGEAFAELVDDDNAGVAASVGIVAISRGDSAEQLLRQADTAMYQAKDKGGSRHEVYAATADDPVAKQVRFESELRRAITGQTLEVWFQPQIHCRTGQLVRVESLIRWAHPEFGLLTPDQFLPLVDELGLMDDLTAFVVRRSLETAVGWTAITRDGNPVPVAVNAGSLGLGGTLAHATIAESLRAFDTPRGLLTLEVTEESLLRDLGSNAFRLDAIRELGVRISLDDFGYTHSSVSYLNGLPLDQLKIDHSFVEQLGARPSRRGGQPQGRRLISAIIDLAHTFDLEVVAEGIEEPAHLEALTELGCDLAQGYLISGPVPADDERLLEFVRGAPFQLPSGDPSPHGRALSQVAGGSSRKPSSSS
jgi:diguanylate cyclase (GGDEF)-like protein/PAS domain S-box-containing protein